MKENYAESLRLVLRSEGGYSNDAHDSGGPTNFGITIEDVRKYLKKDATAADVKALGIEQADNIYRSKYWNELRCDDLPGGVDYAVFDFGVNSGNSRSARFLQRVVGSNADGIIGPNTLAAVAKLDASYIVTKLCDTRLRFLQALGTWQYFGKGWSRRVSEVRAAALNMSKVTAGKVQPPPDIPKPEPKPAAPPPASGGFSLLSLLRFLFWR